MHGENHNQAQLYMDLFVQTLSYPGFCIINAMDLYLMYNCQCKAGINIDAMTMRI
jgi:hypothetical protein